MIDHYINSQQKFIAGWIDEDMKAFSNDAIQWYVDNPNKTNGLLTKNGEIGYYPNEKSCIDCGIPANSPIEIEYLRLLQKAAFKYIELYPWSNNYSRWGVVQGINFQHYLPGQAYSAWHTERTQASGLISSRHLVFMTYLNDVTSGGETEFLHQEIRIKPQKGLTIIWPADWTFTHRGVPSPTENKYIITGWFNFIE